MIHIYLHYGWDKQQKKTIQHRNPSHPPFQVQQNVDEKYQQSLKAWSEKLTKQEASPVPQPYAPPPPPP